MYFSQFRRQISLIFCSFLNSSCFLCSVLLIVLFVMFFNVFMLFYFLSLCSFLGCPRQSSSNHLLIAFTCLLFLQLPPCLYINAKPNCGQPCGFYSAYTNTSSISNTVQMNTVKYSVCNIA